VTSVRRTAALIALLVALLTYSASAVAVRSGGHNPPTRKLEAAFKVAGGLRVASNGCYPGPRRLAAAIRRWAHPDADVANGLGSLDRPGVVYVLRRNARCGHVRFALRDRGKVYILDTSAGEVYVHGRERDRLGAEARRGGRGPLRALELVTRDFFLTHPDRAKRLVVSCPKGKFPLGGGMIATPPLSADGEGVYPHSYERLGTQRGYHITALGIDRHPRRTAKRETTIQVVCGLGLVPDSSPHRTVFVRRHKTNTAVAHCPAGQYLFSGGFQRTNFTTPFRTLGGNYITESRAISSTAWQVRAAAVSHDGGELTAIAYCARSPAPLITEVSASAPLPGWQAATATTPPCPPGLRLTAGGFSFNGSRDAFFAAGWINSDETWSATGFGYLGPAPALTAYGYCLAVSDAV
jgi:hypothetical protein